jgi:hypothetical protein
MKGGASIADPYGLLYNKVESYRHRHPGSVLTTDMFAFLKRRDRKYKFSAISPRLFEAAAEGVCQILRPHDYLGALEPGRHYIPLNRDHSNTDAVLAAMKDYDRAAEIVHAARNVLIESGQFGYQHLISAACDDMLHTTQATRTNSWNMLQDWLVKSAALSDQQDVSLYNAALYLIHESLGREVNRLAVQHVQQQLSNRDLTSWFDTMTEAIRQDRIMWRMPWIPQLII